MKRILIIDDDSAVAAMLKYVIAQEKLGEVVGIVTDELQAVDEILFLKPDIVLIDLLFPNSDGIKIMSQAMSRGASAHFIMISQAQEKRMVEMAYQAGVDFFIHKPINALEIRKVLKNVIQIVEMEGMLSAVRQAVLPSNADAEPSADSAVLWEQKLRDILAEIGILGMTGAQEIVLGVRYLKGRRGSEAYADYQLSDLCQYIAQKIYNGENSTARQKGVEQKIRRAIQKAQSLIAARGNADYYDDVFMEYASRLFDFSQVQQEIRVLQGKSDQPGKVATKKFFEGLLMELEEK